MYKEIYKLIKKFDKIIIARHTGADLDALGSQMALKAIIENSFPSKKVYAIGSYSSRFKFIGGSEKENEEMYKDSLLIVLDTPIIKRVDTEDINNYKNRIKIDHHPIEEKFCDIELINEDASSTCEIIVDLCNNTKLKMNKYAAERLYMGMITDTNRFMHPCSSPKTMRLAADLLEKYNIDKTELYENIYLRGLDEIKFQGYVFQNVKTTKNGVGYICITDALEKEYKVDAGTAGNVVNELSFIKELLVWVTFSEDTKQEFIRGSIRSRGPIINKVALEYNGGGHKLASGIRIKSFDQVDEIIDRLDKLCEEYNEKGE